MITGLAMAEYEKKLHAGDNLIGSTRIVLLSNLLPLQHSSSTARIYPKLPGEFF